ncbi:hypothetical protein N7493_001113 [Penicillium malachiteum]|uniref:Uncharacterized protein n=1 Tax=Penicillium malachiteum TaxID=1324776 RepID=A0AAD6MZL8_9EURO|nr:hypothetical protein N7493_001113 [Penicillium malachiteum]
MTETLGGSTTVVSGTTLTPITTTVTPDVYPSTVASTHDHKIHTKTTHWKSGKPPSPTASPGCAKCGKPCFFCDPDCPTCNTNAAESNDSGDNDNDSSSTTQKSTSCATTTTTSNCDLLCTVTTSASVATTSCTSTVCYTVTGCDVTATTETLTSAATAAACPTVTDGALLQLNGNTFNGCQPCSWHYVPFYDPDDATDTVEWPILAQSSFVYPDIDLKRRGMNTQVSHEAWDELTAIPAATVTATQDSMMTGHPMITSTPKYGSKYGSHVNDGSQVNVLQKRDRAEISALAKCALPVTVYVPSYTPGAVWYASELAKKVKDDQTGMPRWYHTTVQDCQPTVVIADQAVLQAAATAVYNADLAAAKAAGKDDSTVEMPKFPATMDHAWEIGWLKAFLDYQFRPATTVNGVTTPGGMSCNEMEEIFFSCGNELETIYDCLASDTNFEFAGMNKAVNSFKGKISSGKWSGTYRKGVEKRTLLLKKTDVWSSTKDNDKNQQNWGAAKKFTTLRDFLWEMIASCDVVTDATLFALMDKTNSRLYNAFTALDAKIAGTSTWAADFKTFMGEKSTMTSVTTNELVKKMVKVMEEQKPLLLAIAAQTKAAAGATTGKTVVDDANTLIASYDSLVAKYGLTTTDGAPVCANPLVFTWDTTVKKRDTVSSASACTISLTATASATSLALCYAAADPNSGNGGTWCECSGSSEEFPTLAGSDICGYTAIPTYLITTASNPYPFTFTDSLGDKIGCASETVKVSDGTSVTACAGASTTLSIDYANNPYPYTFTDFYGDVVACESKTIFNVDTYALTECAGSRTTEHYATITVTDVVTTSALSKLCEGGSYWQCITDYELQRAVDCGPIPKEHMECVGQVIEDAQLACMTLCVFTTSTYTTVYATRAP